MIVIWSVVAVVLTALLVILVIALNVNGGLHFRLPFVESRVIAAMEKDADEFDSVEIRWKAGDVTISPSADEKMRLTQRSRYDVQELECTVENGRLILRDRSGWGLVFFGIGSRSSDLELQLPTKQYGEVLVGMTSGSTALKGVTADTLRLKMTSGRLTGANLTSSRMEADVTSGKMTVESSRADALTVEVTSGSAAFSGAFRNISGEATSGTVRIATDVLPDTLDGNVTSGKVSFTIPDNDGFSLYCKKTSGSLRSNFDLMSSVNGDKNQYSYGSGGPSYTGKVTSGTLEILKKE